MEKFIAPFAIINVISLLFMCLLLVQFYRIHQKRVAMLALFDSEGELQKKIKSEKWQRYIAMLVYVVFTVAITIVSGLLFFIRPHWL